MRGGEGDGHIPRNIRLTLTALDMIYPWVDMTSVALRADGVNLDVKWRVCGLVGAKEVALAASHTSAV